jgi:hypothetical protein
MEILMLESFMGLGVNIVVDVVGVSKAMRERYIIPAKDFGYKIKCQVLPQLTMKDAVDRRMTNPHGQFDRNIWESVWIKFQAQYEEPTLDEGFDEIIKIV